MSARRERLITQRVSAGFTQESLAAAMGVDRTTVGRWERGAGLPRPWQMANLARLLRVAPTELALLLAPAEVAVPASHARSARTASPSGGPARHATPAEWDGSGVGGALAGAEAGAVSMALMDGGVRVGCRTADGRIVFVTMPRQALLRGVTTAEGATASSRFTVPDVRSVLSPDVHPVENMRSLRRSLVECDNVLGPREVVATAQEHVRLIQYLRREASGRDRHDLLQVQAEYAEFCSWLYQDSGDHRAAQYWADRAVDWATASSDQDLTAYIMARKSQLAGDMQDSIEAIDLAASAQRLAGPGSRLSAMGAVYAAHGHALGGDERTAQHTFDQAISLLAERPEAPVGRGRWLNEAYVEAQRARSLALLGRHREAVAGFEQAIRSLPATYRRDRGVYLSRSAVAQLSVEGPERAAETACAALSIAAGTGSARIFTELARLDALLHGWGGVPEVARFRQALDSLLLHEV
ncbi:helix-turn-helix transcriptional regulator [Kitasatospora sp. NPDC059811]|uniref:helix-turn-helix transcriptional regulator n=1 Tax=Streptomycetaceae TaxID=2062 RepID=UPI000ACAEA65|nr:helix-turn-helix transcriptional regulator [Streptomyces sp. MJM8645]